MKVIYPISFLIICSLGYGSVIAPQSPLELAQQADLIVVGSATAISQSATVISFSAIVNRVIKGDQGLTGKAIPIAWSGAGRGAAQAVGSGGSAGAGVWFLQGSSTGWRLMPVVHGDVPFAMTYIPTQPGPILSPYAYGSTSSLWDKVAAEVSSAIESNLGTGNFVLSTLGSGLMDDLNSEYSQVFYSRMSTSALAAQQVLGLSGLIRQGNSQALSAAIQPAFSASAAGSGILLLSIRHYFRATDPASVAILGHAAVDLTNPAAVREALAHALAATHTTATLPYLAALLDDQDENLRVEGVGGLGAFANGLPVQTNSAVPSLAYLQFPANAPYMTEETRANFALGSQAIERNEASYLGFWKQWWAQNRASLGF